MTALKIRKVGNSLGLVLPMDIIAKLRAKEGDTLYVVNTPSGVELTPYNPEFATQMDAARRAMRDDRDALKELAK